MMRWIWWGACIALAGPACAQSCEQVAETMDQSVLQLNGAELGLLHCFLRY